MRKGFIMNKRVRKKKLNSNISSIYMSITAAFALCILFLLTSKITLNETFPIKNSEINKLYDFGTDGSLKIVDWIYDESKNKMEIYIQSDKMKKYDNDIKFTAISRVDTLKMLDVTVEYEENGDYAVLIGSLPKNFKQVALRINKATKEFDKADDKNYETFAVLYTDERIVKRDNIIPKTRNEYGIEVLDATINNLVEDNENKKEEIEETTKTKKVIMSEITTLTEEKIFQTQEQRELTDADIDNLYQKIKEADGKSDEILKIIQENNNAIEKAKQKQDYLKQKR